MRIVPLVLVLVLPLGCGMSSQSASTHESEPTALTQVASEVSPLRAADISPPKSLPEFERDRPDVRQAVGLWRIPQDQVEQMRGRVKPQGGDQSVVVCPLSPEPFYYDGETVTLHLLTLKEWMWRSED